MVTKAKKKKKTPFWYGLKTNSSSDHICMVSGVLLENFTALKIGYTEKAIM